MTNVKENTGYVSAEYLKKAAQNALLVKQRSYQLMQIKPDSRILDVGCGPAIDTIPLSEYIGEKGRIVGVDKDPEMVKKANQELTKLKITKRVQHQIGDVKLLPFDDGEFDQVHAERLFQVLPEKDSKKVFNEMNRVLKSNGIIVLVDTDWASASINFSNSALERKLINYFASEMRPNGFAGRQLLDLLKENNYRDITIELFPHVIRDFSETPFGDWLTTEASKNNIATKQELNKWNQELAQKTKQDKFLSYVNAVLVAGKKP